ncbi:hypothetical protein LX64_03158 [Chitinophaga skermanii]|uniref:GAF domain-containing protein n=2 Tax=Chitinophaga skermanii TaxID=331697 RepID=A0A327QJT9_9BACT|nr:hypothetical protein LX64_03158 [Chitinophaga skermanii]
MLTAHPKVFEDEEQVIESHVSFEPFIRFMKEKAETTPGIRSSFYNYIIKKFESMPSLLGSFDENSDLVQYQEYLDLLIATLFPVTTDEENRVYGVGVPYKYSIFYYSEGFKQIFAINDNELKAVPAGISIEKVKRDKLIWLYKLILERVYNAPINFESDVLQTVINPETGLKRYVKVDIDARFVDVKVKGKLPEMDCSNFCSKPFKDNNLKTLQEVLPLELFALEGFVIWTIQDVTKDEVVTNIKNIVLNTNKENEEKSYTKLREGLHTLIELPDVNINLMPFLKVNGKYVLENNFAYNSIILNNTKADAQLYQQLLNYLTQNQQPLVIPNVNSETTMMYSFLKYLPFKGVKSYILIPVLHNGELLGIIEIATGTEGALGWQILTKLHAAYSLCAMMLRRSLEINTERINEVIKLKFTALQPAVEWKFNEAAWNFLHKADEPEGEIEPIQFTNVYPLYGAVDVRNSSVERGNALKEDLREQMELIAGTLQKIRTGDGPYLPLLEELEYKNNMLVQFLRDDNLVAEEEAKINDFFDHEIAPTFRHLYDGYPDLKPILEDYFTAIDPKTSHIFNHRKSYEESLQQINHVINQYLEKERETIQLSFPCYFEKYRTDGVEYNIYIGQSISPDKKYDALYLRNLSLWQLTSMAAIAKLTNKLMPTLQVPLQTTQLILVHSNPIDISFRKDERRFDVEGAYNIRYEIMKKRIDKVHINGSTERLTQPGTIALVYSYAREADEYLKYINFLQDKKVLLPGVEMLDLEELQGISGLKALRVKVNLEDDKK